MAYLIVLRLIMLCYCLGAVFQDTGDFRIRSDHQDGQYQTNETVDWKLQWHADSQSPKQVQYQVLAGGFDAVSSGSIDLVGNVAHVQAK